MNYVDYQKPGHWHHSPNKPKSINKIKDTSNFDRFSSYSPIFRIESISLPSPSQKIISPRDQYFLLIYCSVSIFPFIYIFHTYNFDFHFFFPLPFFFFHIFVLPFGISPKLHQLISPWDRGISNLLYF